MAVDIAELVRGAIGESEAALAELFQRAQDAAPCIIFLDELQAAFATADDEAGGGGGGQLVSQLKLQLDSLARRDKAAPAVYVIGATNEVGMLDDDVLRPGRFDRVIRVELPNLSAREAILQALLARLPLDLRELERELASRGVGGRLPVEVSARGGGGDGGLPSGHVAGVAGAGAQGDGGTGKTERSLSRAAPESAESGVHALAKALAQVTPQCSGADLRHLCQLAAYDALNRDPDAQVIAVSNFFAVLSKVCKSPAPESQGTVQFGNLDGR